MCCSGAAPPAPLLLTSRPFPFFISVVTDEADRRRHGRVGLDEPLPATYGDLRAAVVDLSLRGFRIAHEDRLPAAETRTLTIDWHGSQIAIGCTVVRSVLARLGRLPGERSLYHSGLAIVETSREAFDRLRELIAERVMRALDEQKANARGIPPLAAYMYQPEKGELYRRCEYIAGNWRKSETSRPAQPMSGFTISAEVPPHHVEMLCRTWENTTAEGRRLTRLLAELSISRAEGIPTRRYVP